MLLVKIYTLSKYPPDKEITIQMLMQLVFLTLIYWIMINYFV